MSKRELLNEINCEKHKREYRKTLKKINMLKSNEDVDEIVKGICKKSIDLAKKNLDSNHDDEKNKINLYKIIEKDVEKYNKLNNIKCECNICKDKIILDGKICNCFQNVIKKNRVESFDEELPLNSFNFDNFDLNYYSDEFDKNLNCTYKDLIKQTFNFCMNYAKKFNKDSDNLLFVGGTGVGKTHLSCSIGNEVAKNKFSVSYVSLPRELINFNKQGSDIKEKKFDSDLLIIDDLGLENSSLFNNSILYDLINIRIIKRMSTILITNLSIKDLGKRYSQNIVSRIIGNFLKVSLVGNDIRQCKFMNKNREQG